MQSKRKRKAARQNNPQEEGEVKESKGTEICVMDIQTSWGYETETAP